MKISLVLTLWVLVVVVHADESSWNRFKIRNNKVYKNRAELELRQKIFNENLQNIEEHNKKYEQGLVSYKLGINQFSDLTAEEFAALSKPLEADEKIFQGGLKYFDTTNKAIPDEFDWRTQSVVSEVKDQKDCGSCWAFSATGTLESQVAIQTGELKSFSEQQLVDCDESNNGCVNGIVQLTYNYIKDNGLTLEGNYSYEGVKKECRISSTTKPVVWVKDYVNIPQYDETALKQAVALIGPISIGINVDPLQFYQEGIFDGECPDDIDHFMLAVGYGKDEKTGVEYWIMKNSYGPEWGEQGYIRIKMGEDICGLAKQACYPILEDSGF